jgi:hypothetical protein
LGAEFFSALLQLKGSSPTVSAAAIFHRGADVGPRSHNVDDIFPEPSAAQSEEPATEAAGRRSQADLVVELADALGVELMHDAAQTPYAIVKQGGVQMVQAIRSSAFVSLLAKEFFDRNAKVPTGTALSDARKVLEGRAVHGGPLVNVGLRIAGDEDVIDIDLGDCRWRMAHVTCDGWTIEPHADRFFRRAPGLLELPAPIRGGSLVELQRFVRVDDADYPLLVAFLVNAIRHRGPYPILLLTGEQGTAKTTTARILRRLIDPNKADVRAEPRENRDLAIAANNGHMLVLDNLSNLSAQMSDALCRLSTGGGFSTRTLYTNDEEIIFDGQRPIIITSIGDVASRADLLDRCLTVRLRPIPEGERRTEAELWEMFGAAQPRLFGALLDVISVALRNVRDVDRAVRLKPRMADAFTWALAAAPALGIQDDVIVQAWNSTRDEAYAATIESSVIAAPVLRLISEGGGEWTGTATELYAQVEALADDATKRRREWPRSPKALASQVRVIAPALRARGVDHAERRGPGTGARLHFFTETLKKAADASQPSRASHEAERSDASDASVTQSPGSDRGSVTAITQRDMSRDDRDACDDLFPALSGDGVDNHHFTIVAGGDGRLAACLACGGSWELHGCPAQSAWRLVDDPADYILTDQGGLLET